jgi:hypothetical protein
MTQTQTEIVKAVEGDVGIPMALEIWKKLDVSRYGAEHPKAWLEAELSIATWLNCNSENDYNNNMWHYRNINNKVMRKYTEEKQAEDKKFPPLTRYYGKICKMTLKTATMSVERDTKTASTKLTKAISVNEGQGLNLNVLNNFTNQTIKKLVEVEKLDPKIAVEMIKGINEAVAHNTLLSQMDKKEAFKGIADSFIEILNNRPEITIQDQKHFDAFGKRDTLSDQNPNVDKDGNTGE